MKKILLSLLIVSLGLTQVPLYGSDRLIAFAPEQRNMSLMAKCTLIVAIIAAAYGCTLFFKAWSGDQGKTEPKDTQKEPMPPIQDRAAADHDEKRHSANRESQAGATEINRSACSAAPMAGSPEPDSPESSDSDLP